MATRPLLILVVWCLWLGPASGASPPPIKAVDLGGWLVLEDWITPEFFPGVDNNALMDGTHVTLWSVTRKMFLSASGGGGSTVAANQRNGQSWETFRLWKLELKNKFKIRADQDQFVSLDKNGNLVATVKSPSQAEIFQIIRNGNRARFQASNQKFLQVQMDGSVKGNGEDDRSWSDSDPSVFLINITEQMKGDMQFCSFYGPDQAVKILQDHWKKFITENDFNFISSNGLNAVRIPIAWWITNASESSSCHPPSYPGYGAVLDKAFEWAE